MVFDNIANWMKSIQQTIKGVELDFTGENHGGSKVIGQIVVLIEEFLKYETECELFVDELESHISSIEELVSSSKLDRIVIFFLLS